MPGRNDDVDSGIVNIRGVGTWSRRSCIQAGALSVFASIMSHEQAANGSMNGCELIVDGNALDTDELDIIDCHTHFYDPSRPEGVPWPEKGTSLYRTVLPEHLRAQTMYRKVTGTVVVEASSRIEDNDWLLEIARNDPFIVGIVGRVDPGTPSYREHIVRLAANPLFRGIRVMEPIIQAHLEKNDLAPFRLLDELGLALDVNGGPTTPNTIDKLAAKIPTLRIVLNHIANIEIDSNPPPKPWSEAIRRAASHENVFCKVSALLEGAARNGRVAPRNLDFYRPFISTVWNEFGNDRVIYGSNWPVSDLAADYASVQRIVMEYASEKGTETLRRFCSQNSITAYRWTERVGRR